MSKLNVGDKLHYLKGGNIESTAITKIGRKYIYTDLFKIEKNTLKQVSDYSSMQFHENKQHLVDKIRLQELNGAIYSAIDRNRFSNNITLEKLEKIAEILCLEI